MNNKGMKRRDLKLGRERRMKEGIFLRIRMKSDETDEMKICEKQPFGWPWYITVDRRQLELTQDFFD